jgi:hypothetical protein
LPCVALCSLQIPFFTRGLVSKIGEIELTINVLVDIAETYYCVRSTFIKIYPYLSLRIYHLGSKIYGDCKELTTPW